MKRIGILTILLIFLCSVQPAWANTEEGVAAGKEKHDVFDIYDLSGELYVWKGTALPLLPGVLLTSAANLPAETEHIGLSDGNGMWEARAVLPLFQGRTAFILFDAETEPPAVTPWPLMVSRSPTAARDIYVYHVTGAGDRIYRSVSGISPQGPEDADGMVLMLKAEAAPGDPILTDGGELAGMITAEYAEGEYRYSAVSAQGILNLLAQLYSLNENDGFTSCPDEGFEVTREENRVTFDWSGVQKETEEGQRLWLVIHDTGNNPQCLTVPIAEQRIEERFPGSQKKPYEAGKVLGRNSFCNAIINGARVGYGDGPLGYGDGPFVSVPLFLVPTVGKTGGQIRKDRPYMSI